MKNLRNRVDLRFVKNKKDYFNWTTKPNFVTQKIFDDNLVSIHKIKTTLRLNKPASVGICTSDLCKVPIYEIHYEYVETSMAAN